jgi:thiamine-monophosphate kinase
MERNPDGTLTETALELVYDVHAREKAGRALATSGYAHACIDLSDGLGPCLAQMMEASGKGAELDWRDVPLAEGLEAFAVMGIDLREMALSWGGEYELLAAIDPDGVEPLVQVLRRLGLEPAVVGRVHGEARKNIIITEHGQEALSPHGFDHFQEWAR